MHTTCHRRIAIFPMIPQDSPSLYDSAMDNLVVALHPVARQSEKQIPRFVGNVSS
jgi:hypothetical protein